MTAYTRWEPTDLFADVLDDYNENLDAIESDFADVDVEIGKVKTQIGGVKNYSGTISAGNTASVIMSQSARAVLVAVLPHGSTATANHALSVVMIYNASFGQAYPLKSGANVTIGVSGYSISISTTVASTYRIIEF